MNEILQPYLVELLELVKTTGSFIVGELPVISKEIIMWGVVGNIIPIVILPIVIGMLMMVATIIKKATDTTEFKFFSTDRVGDMNHWQAVIYIIIACISAVIGIVWIIVFSKNMGTILKAIFAPRLFLIEQIKLML